MKMQRLKFVIVLCGILLISTAYAADKTLNIGYLELDSDPRYVKETVEAHYQAHAWGRPYDGAEVAIKESRFSGSREHQWTTIQPLLHAVFTILIICVRM